MKANKTAPEKRIAPENNFADVMEAAGKLLKSTKNDEARLLAGMVVIMANRSDKLEREVELLNRPARASTASSSAAKKKPSTAKAPAAAKKPAAKKKK